MFSKVSRPVACFLALALTLVFESGAMAQQSTPDPLMPNANKLRPWEKRLQRFYNQGNAQQETDKATKQLYRDPMRKLGLPENKPFQQHGGAKPGAPPPTLGPGVAGLDRDNNGTISRDEYFRGRERLMLPGGSVTGRGRRMINRLDSQFRRADRNRDGVVTPQELQESGGRF